MTTFKFCKWNGSTYKDSVNELLQMIYVSNLHLLKKYEDFKFERKFMISASPLIKQYPRDFQ